MISPKSQQEAAITIVIVMVALALHQKLAKTKPRKSENKILKH
jgi:hypothetical protein